MPFGSHYVPTLPENKLTGGQLTPSQKNSLSPCYVSEWWWKVSLLLLNPLRSTLTKCLLRQSEDGTKYSCCVWKMRIFPSRRHVALLVAASILQKATVFLIFIIRPCQCISFGCKQHFFWCDVIVSLVSSHSFIAQSKIISLL